MIDAPSLSSSPGPDRRWEPMHTLEALYDAIEPAFAFKAQDRAGWAAWRSGFVPRLRTLLGLDTLAQAFPQKPRGRCLHSTDCGQYTRALWEVSIGAGVTTLCFVLTPAGADAARYPVLIAAHGHGEGVNTILGLEPDGSPRPADTPDRHHDYALQAVRAGYLVLAPEIGDFGRRRNFTAAKLTADTDGTYFAKNSCYVTAMNGAALGVPALGLRAWETMRQLDWLLEQHPAARGDRVGMFGLSGGGALTLYTAALDERIAAAGICGYLTRWGGNMLHMPHCLCNLVPGLLTAGEIDDVAALIAPRRLVVECSRTDGIFPFATAELAIEKLERVYHLLDADAAFAADRFDGKAEFAGHEFSGSRLWEHVGAAVNAPSY